MSSYIRRYEHPSTRVISHHRYRFLRSYGLKRDAVSEASRWNREPGISAKVTSEKGIHTVWVYQKPKG
jgi:hypothetical protein